MPEEPPGTPGTPAHTPDSARTALERAGATPPAADAPSRIGPYVPLGVLGGGGMGRVYLAKPADDRPELAAVKVIRPEYAEDAEFRRRFRREADVHGRVRTPYAPALLGTGFQESLLWTATEYLPGLNLAAAVRDCGPLGPAGVWRLTAELGRALTALSTVDIVHRDLKPSNVVVSARGGGGHGARAHVIDFGISQAVDSSAITTTGSRVGTPAYMAPEYLREGRCDTASDVFSLACTLVHAATGRGPFGDGTGLDVMHRVAFEDPRPEVMAEVAARAPELAGLLTACLAKSPATRPSPQQLVDAATARHELARVWPEPLHSRLLERERACDVLRDVPSATTRPLPAPTRWDPPAQQPQAPAYGPYPAPAPAPGAYGPHTPPAGYRPDDAPVGFPGDAGSLGPSGAAVSGAVRTDGPRRRRRTVALAAAAAVAVCAVVLSAFLLTRPDGSGADRAAESPPSGAPAAPDGGPAGASPGGASPEPSGSGTESERPDGQEDGASPSPASGGGKDPDGTATSGGAAGGDGGASQGSGGGPDTPDPTPEPTEEADPPWLSQCTYYSGTALTRYGDSGTRVVQVQCMLVQRGYGVGEAGVDGQFGDATLAAVKRFQAAEGLTVDGDVGPRTWSALRSRT